MDTVIKEDIAMLVDKNCGWNKLKNKNILISGANGYLSSYIVYALMEANDKYNLNMTIYALCRNREKALGKFENYVNRSCFELLIQNVQDEFAGEYQFEYIIHAASPANPFVFRDNPYSVIEANVMGMHNLLKNCFQWKTEKLLLFSSYAVYGDMLPADGAKEDFRGSLDFTDSRYAYHLSKQMMEMMGMCFKEKNGIKVSVVRPSIIYGPGMGYSQKKHITDFVKNYILDEDIELKSDGSAVRSFLYILDATDAFLKILLQDEDGIFNVSSEKSVCSVRELAELFTTFDKKLKVSINIPTENASYLNTTNDIGVVSNEKLRKMGWEESVSLREGVQRTIRWAEANDFINM